MKIACTGHRPNKLGNDYNYTGPICCKIRTDLQEVIDTYSPDILISGMALGVDTIWAELDIINNLNLIAAVPFLGQELMWPNISQHRYNNILSYKKCEKKIICPGGYHPSKMQIRNEWMVDNCDFLVAVWNGTSGGTANCIEYAYKVGKTIVPIDLETIESNKLKH